MIKEVELNRLVSDLYKNIADCMDEIDKLSYDDTEQRTNRVKIAIFAARIECYKETIERLRKMQEH